MPRYDDLRANARFARLKPLAVAELGKLRSGHPTMPDDYEDFLRELGAGQVGSASFMIYDGLVDPDTVFGSRGAEIRRLLLFGDDFQGYSAGFDPDRNWSVVEVDPTNDSVDIVAPTFEEFVRKRLA